jgi:hypothetical protein
MVSAAPSIFGVPVAGVFPHPRASARSICSRARPPYARLLTRIGGGSTRPPTSTTMAICGGIGRTHQAVPKKGGRRSPRLWGAGGGLPPGAMPAEQPTFQRWRRNNSRASNRPSALTGDGPGRARRPVRQWPNRFRTSICSRRSCTDRDLPGESLWPAIGGGTAHREIFAEYHAAGSDIRQLHAARW